MGLAEAPAGRKAFGEPGAPRARGRAGPSGAGRQDSAPAAASRASRGRRTFRQSPFCHSSAGYLPDDAKNDPAPALTGRALGATVSGEHEC